MVMLRSSSDGHSKVHVRDHKRKFHAPSAQPGDGMIVQGGRRRFAAKNRRGQVPAVVTIAMSLRLAEREIAAVREMVIDAARVEVSREEARERKKAWVAKLELAVRMIEEVAAPVPAVRRGDRPPAAPAAITDSAAQNVSNRRSDAVRAPTDDHPMVVA